MGVSAARRRPATAPATVKAGFGQSGLRPTINQKETQGQPRNRVALSLLGARNATFRPSISGDFLRNRSVPFCAR